MCGFLGATDLLTTAFCQEAEQLMIGAWHVLHSMQPGSPHDEIIRRRQLDDQESHIHCSGTCSYGKSDFPQGVLWIGIKAE